MGVPGVSQGWYRSETWVEYGCDRCVKGIFTEVLHGCYGGVARMLQMFFTSGVIVGLQGC